MSNSFLKIAGGLSFVASTLHIAIVFGGAPWYRFFGAGEAMAVLAEQGSSQPMVVTLVIASILAVWGAYAWSGAGILPKLPLLRTALVLITLVYLVRGALGLIAPFVSDHPQLAQNSLSFWVWSSLICFVFGLVHLKGLVEYWTA